MSWHSWVIGWLKGFHCLKVRTLLRFHSDWKFHFVSTNYFYPLIWFGEYPTGSLKREANNFQCRKLCAFLAINISLPFNSKSKNTYNWFYPWQKTWLFTFTSRFLFGQRRNLLRIFGTLLVKGLEISRREGADFNFVTISTFLSKYYKVFSSKYSPSQVF